MTVNEKYQYIMDRHSTATYVFTSSKFNTFQIFYGDVKYFDENKILNDEILQDESYTKEDINNMKWVYLDMNCSFIKEHFILEYISHLEDTVKKLKK